MIEVEDVVPLARGGTADLFLARSAGQRVVLKLARVDQPAAAGVLASEAAILARLGGSAAPRLLGRTRAHDRDALVLEYIGLPTLRATVVAERDRLALAVSVCEAVARIHDAGVVHADLTPSNVLVDPAARSVRLIDFGLAAAIGDPLAPLITAGYAAPERATDGCRAQPSVDVYALGVICFELLTGELPFAGSNRMLRVGHAAGRVPRASERVPVSPEVDDAIVQAMAKDPAARPADATALAALLRRASSPARPVTTANTAPITASLVGFTWSANAAALRDALAVSHAVIAYSKGARHVAMITRGDTRSSAERLASVLRAAGAVELDVIDGGESRAAAIKELARPRTVRTPVPRSPLLGRDGVRSVIASAATGGVALVTIWGEVGLGKSRVAEAIAEQLAPDFTVVSARAPSAAELADLVQPDARDDASEVDRAALAIVTGRAEVTGSAAAPLAAAPGALRQAAARALGRALVGRDRRFALIIDDAHEADPIVLDALELATMAAAGGPLIVALARPALAVTRPRWSRRAAVALTLTLEPLTGEDGRAFIRGLLPATAAVPGAALDRLVDRCGGVPLYMIELVGVLQRAAGSSRTGTRGALATDHLDTLGHHDVVAFAVADELAALPIGTRAVAETIAIAGRPVAAAEIHALFGALEREGVRLPIDPGVATAQLVTAGLLVERGGLGFRHDVVRDAVAARVPEPSRLAIHRAMLASGLAATLEEQAHHAECAGDRDAAAIGWRRAALAALSRHDDLASERILGRALAATATPDAELARLRGAVRARLGRHDAAASDFAAARELARIAGDRGGSVDVLLDEATALDWSLQFDAAAARVREATALAHDEEPPLRRARLAMARGRCAWRARDAAAAIQPLRDAIALADPLGDDGYETAIASRLILGFILGTRHEIDEAAHVLDGARATATARGDLQHAAAERLNRYPVHASRGDADALYADMGAFAAAGRELGVAVTEYRGELYQALVSSWCGRDEIARGHATTARRLEEADVALFAWPAAALVLAELAARRGDRADAVHWYEIARDHGEPRAIDRLMLEALEAWLADRLDLDRATELATRASSIGDPEVAFQLYELVARTATRSGDHVLAEAAHAAARALANLPRFMPTSDELP